MRRIKATAALAVVAAASFVPGPAAAHEELTPSFRISPGTLAIGQVLEIWINEKTCPGGPDGPITSPGFHPPANSSGAEAWASSTPGTYSATLKCSGSSKIGTAEFTVLERVSATFRLTPERPRPGETFRAEVDPIACPDGPFVFSSTGFRDAQRPNLLEGVVVDTPGRYSVAVQCRLGRNLIKGGGMFEIAEPAAATTDKAEQPRAPEAAQRKPIIKPKGAPETGGGDTVVSVHDLS